MNTPTLDEWRRLYDLAIQVKSLAPWQWMTEADLFGVQNPETKELGFVSVMGMVEEHFAIGVYRGAEGLYRLLDFAQAAPFVEPMELFQIPQLQLSFEDREMLEAEDRAVIQQLGLKFRGRQAWPLFRDYRPGLAPWFVDRADARFIGFALEQLLEVAPQVKDHPNWLDQGDDERYLVRVPKKQQRTWVWTDQVKRIRPPKPTPIEVMMDTELLAAVKKLPKGKYQVEVDCFLLPTPIGPKGIRPYYPYMLLVVDAQAGVVMGFEMLEPKPSVDAMWGMVPLTLIQQLASTGRLPQEIRVGMPLLMALLKGITDELDIPVKLVSMLPALDAARSSLETFIRR